MMLYKEEDVPEARFAYNISPMSVLVRSEKRPWYDFVTKVLAIVGGTFSVVSRPPSRPEETSISLFCVFGEPRCVCVSCVFGWKYVHAWQKCATFSFYRGFSISEPWLICVSALIYVSSLLSRPSVVSLSLSFIVRLSCLSGCLSLRLSASVFRLLPLLCSSFSPP